MSFFAQFLRFGVAARVYSLVALSLAGMMIMVALEVNSVRQTILQNKKLELQHLSEAAMSLIKAEAVKAEKGDITLEQAQLQAKAKLKELRYGGNEYFWINDMKPSMVMHPIRAELDGKDLSTNKDPNGKLLFVEFVNTVKASGAGFVDYMWPKPGQDQPQPKLSYVAGFQPWGWVVGTGVYIDDVDARVIEAAKHSLLTASLLFVLVAGVAIWQARHISHSVRMITQRMHGLAQGHLDGMIEGQQRADEIGEMARALAIFQQQALENKRLHQETAAQEQKLQEQRREALIDLAAQLETSVQGIASTVAQSAEAMMSSSSQISSVVEKTGEETARTENVASTTAANMNSVASASEEMSASIGEIAQRVAESSQLAQTAVTEVERTTAVVATLNQASEQIGQIVTLIQSIAEQTNLLALNATIEAARAGEAGRGFAVVASEVKTLATQTSKATQDIADQISSIQASTQNAVSAISSVGQLMAQLNTNTGAIAAVVEEQGAVTQEITRRIMETATLASHMADNVQNIQTMMTQNRQLAEGVSSDAAHLATHADGLQEQVQIFVSQLRAG